MASQKKATRKGCEKMSASRNFENDLTRKVELERIREHNKSGDARTELNQPLFCDVAGKLFLYLYISIYNT